jgi:hypothetical protein
VVAARFLARSLQSGAPVKLSGIKVGKVKAVELFGGKEDPVIHQRVQVRVTAWVEDRVADSIRGDAEFFINTAGERWAPPASHIAFRRFQFVDIGSIIRQQQSAVRTCQGVRKIQHTNSIESGSGSGITARARRITTSR